MHVTGTTDLEIHSVIIWLGPFLGLPYVSPFRSPLLRWSDFPLTNSLNLCPKGKFWLEYSGKMHMDLKRKFHHAVCRCSVISPGFCCCYSAPAFNFSLCPSGQRTSLKFSRGWRRGSCSGQRVGKEILSTQLFLK